MGGCLNRPGYPGDGYRVIHLTVSLGVTETRPADSDAEKPFLRVDEAMYNAKKEGTNRVSVV